ncbi:hypothetical protein MRB53_039391 [Persea americana]|nr:hypothetical protein MRB53_039391 [Persea americana]
MQDIEERSCNMMHIRALPTRVNMALQTERAETNVVVIAVCAVECSVYDGLDRVECVKYGFCFVQVLFGLIQIVLLKLDARHRYFGKHKCVLRCWLIDSVCNACQEPAASLTVPHSSARPGGPGCLQPPCCCARDRKEVLDGECNRARRNTSSSVPDMSWHLTIRSSTPDFPWTTTNTFEAIAHPITLSRHCNCACQVSAGTHLSAAILQQCLAQQDFSVVTSSIDLVRRQGHSRMLNVDGRLARSGCTVVIPYRDEYSKRHLKVTGDLGRVWNLEFDLRNLDSIDECLRHSDIVYNLIGREYETKNYSYEDVHVEGATRIAEAVAKYDVDRFVHVSSFNADPNSPSRFFSTKGKAEEVVRRIFPETTIVRPAPLFGWEDHLLNRFAGESTIWASNNLQELRYPVHAIDVGAALEVMCQDDSTAGQTYELYGPTPYTMSEQREIVAKEIVKVRPVVNIPQFLRKPVNTVLGKALWWTHVNSDQVTREFIDQSIDPLAKTFRDLGIEPCELTACTYEYLQGFRSNVYYDLPPMTEARKEGREEVSARVG